MTNSVATSKVLWNAENTAGARIAQFNWRFDERASHVVQGTLTVGDTISVESIVSGQVDDGAGNLTTVDTYCPVTGSPFSATPFAVVLQGPITGVRVTKTGTTGAATVIVVG